MSALDDAKALLGERFDRQYSDPCDADSQVQDLAHKVDTLRDALLLVIEALEAWEKGQGGR